MILNGVLCTISVIVSNLSCLALFSFFNSILSSKRNILTQLNTVLVFVMTAVVDTLVRLEKEIQSFYENAIFLNMTYFPVWQHSDLSNICTPNPSGDDSPARFILALVAISRRSCSSQSHKDFPDTQGKYKSMKRNPTITNVFSRQSSPSWIMRGGFSKSSSAFWLQPQYTHLLLWASTTWLLKVRIKKNTQILYIS